VAIGKNVEIIVLEEATPARHHAAGDLPRALSTV
jgi:hypothetical protein